VAKRTRKTDTAEKPATDAAKRRPKRTPKPQAKSAASSGPARPAPKRSAKSKSGTNRKPAATRKSSGSTAAANKPVRKRPASPKSNKRGAAAQKPAKPAAPPKLRKSKLKPEETEEFRLLLLAKRAEIIGDVGTLTDEALRTNRQESAGDLSLMPNHMADLGSDNWEQEFTLGLIDNERVLLREIDEALERIENGTYGICVATNKPITKARLRAKPWALYTIEYARELERKGML
jgi:DnaK suppressor protein